MTSTLGMAFHHWLQRRLLQCHQDAEATNCRTQREMDVSLLLTLYEPGNGFSFSCFYPHQVFRYSFQRASSFHGNGASSFQVAWGGHSESMDPRLRSGFWAGTSHVDAMCHGETQKMNHHPPCKHWLVIYTTILYCVAAWAPDLSPWQENAGNFPPSLRNPRGPPPTDSCLGRGNVHVFCPSCLWVDVLCRIFKFQKCLHLLKLFCPHLGYVSISIRPSLF